MLLLPPYAGLNKFLFFFTFIATFELIVYIAFTVLTVGDRGSRTVVAQFPSSQIVPFSHTTHTREA